jgi:hypothetical protein
MKIKKILADVSFTILGILLLAAIEIMYLIETFIEKRIEKRLKK